MTPHFARAVDPIFLRVLSVLDVAAAQTVDPESLHLEMQAKLQKAEGEMMQPPWSAVWEQARYALCAWIDDVLTNKPWDGQRWWQENKLEFHFFRTNVAGTEFFQRAKQAQQLPQRDAIEVYYIAVVLGFRGLYGMPDSPFLAQQHALPVTIEDWARRTAAAVSVRHSQGEASGVSVPLEGAPALGSRFAVVGTLLYTLALSIAAVLLAGWVLMQPAGR